MLTLSREEQKALDKYLIKDCGVDLFILMEGAAHSICRFVLNKFTTDTKIRVFAGAGNNGGDAYAVARLLSAFYRDVAVYETKEAKERCLSDTESATAKNRSLLKNLQIEVELTDKYKVESDCLIIDGVLGSGFDIERELNPNLSDVLDKIVRAKQRNCKVLSIDIPSGVDANTGHAIENAVHADYTVSFVYPKRGMSSYPGRDLAGEIIIGNLGIPKSIINKFLNNYPEYLVRICDKDFVKEQKIERATDGHKGTFGKVLVVAGSSSMPGAALLACGAALRSGAGLIKVFSSSNTCEAINKRWPEVITYTRKIDFTDIVDNYRNNLEVISDEVKQELENNDFDKFKSVLEQVDVCLMGPGLGATQKYAEWIKYAIKNAKILILDADALNVIAESEEKDTYIRLCQQRVIDHMMPVIMTPHPGEYIKLMPELVNSSRMEQAMEMCRQWSVILVLKGASTLTAIPQSNCQVRLFANSSGNNGLAKGGSGDVLAGLIAGLVAQCKNEPKVVALSVYIHGYAADLLAERKNTRVILPSDVIEAFSEVFDELAW